MKRGSVEKAPPEKGGGKGPRGGKPRGGTSVETVTCMHCRYERPAADAHCHICGYPWPWMKR